MSMNTYKVFKPEVGDFVFPSDFQLLDFLMAWLTSSASIALHGWFSRCLCSSSCFLIHSAASLWICCFPRFHSSTVQLHQMLAVHPHQYFLS